MSSKLIVFACVPSLLLLGCASNDAATARRQAIQSCFSDGAGMTCVPTPGQPVMTPTDVNGDGVPDAFMCADTDEDGDDRIDAEDDDDDNDGTPDVDDEDSLDCHDDDDSEPAMTRQASTASGGEVEHDDDGDDDDHDGVSNDDDEDDDDDGVDDSVDCDDHDHGDDEHESHDD